MIKMKYHKHVLFVMLAFAVGCTGSNNDKEQEEDLPDYKAHLDDNKEQLESWLEDLEDLTVMKVTESPQFQEKADITFDFSPVKGTHSGNASPNPDFNSILLSTYSFNKELHPDMKRDFFKCDLYEIVHDLINDEPTLSTAIPGRDDDRFPSAAIAYMEATKNVKYVFLVDVEAFNRGSVSALMETLYPGVMKGYMTIYDIQKDELLEYSSFEILGYESLYWSVDEGDSFDDQQKTADYELDQENEKYYPKELLKNYAPDNNYY